MPKEVRYKGGAVRVTITDDQWEQRELNNPDVTWNGHGDVQEVNNDVAEWLFKHDAGRFEDPNAVETKPTESSGGGRDSDKPKEGKQQE